MDQDTDHIIDDHSDVSEIAGRNLRVLEALLFAAKEPLNLEEAKPFLSDGADLLDLADQLTKKISACWREPSQTR